MIFLSHSVRDLAATTQIADWLQKHGFGAIFVDFDEHAGIPPGAHWESTLYRELLRSEAVVVILTSNWLNSKWCFAEFTQARALGKAIFPLILPPAGDCMLSPDIQHIDLRQDRSNGLARLEAALRNVALNIQGGFDWDGNRPAFPGLTSFQEEDAAVYFGRNDETRGLVERVNARRTLGGARLVLLLGGSGSGKSSLLRAGLIPRLRRDRKNWIPLPPFRPQLRPIDEMARAMSIALPHAGGWRYLRERLIQDDRSSFLQDFADDLRERAGANEGQILLSVDQAEELFAASDKEERTTFFSVLMAAMSEHSPYLVVMAMRSDYLREFLEERDLQILHDEFTLRPLSLTKIGEIIEGPARVAGLLVDRDFVIRATQDAETEDALPLLAFVLRELSDRSAKAGRLTLSDYLSLGDTKEGTTPLESAVWKAADDALARISPTPQELHALREAFVPSMVRINDNNEYLRRAAPWNGLPQLAHRSLEELARARLLVIRQGQDEPIAEVAHEALLRKWPLLRAWLDEDRRFLVWVNSVTRELSKWREAPAGYKKYALLNGWQLLEAWGWLVDRPSRIDPDVASYIERSHFARYYAQLGLSLTLLAVALSFVIHITEGYGVEMGHDWNWLADPASQVLITHVNILRLADVILLSSVVALVMAAARRYMKKSCWPGFAGWPLSAYSSELRRRWIYKAINALFFLLMGIVGAVGNFKNVAPSTSVGWMVRSHDAAQLRRGFKVYNGACQLCHTLHVRFRDFAEPGGPSLTLDAVSDLAAQYKIKDGPNEEGEMFERPARPGDAMPTPFPNDQAARTANNGVFPIDLPLSDVKTPWFLDSVGWIHDVLTNRYLAGATRVYLILTGYGKSEIGSIPAGKYRNSAADTGFTGMPPPLSDGVIDYDDGTETTVDQYASDVATFLGWASEPRLEDRNRMALRVYLHVLLVTVVLFITRGTLWGRRTL
jgi:cytochrome c1